MENYCLYIVQQSGVPIYYHNFSEKFNDTEYPLITSFFGAIMQFSQQVIHEKLSIMEMGQYRIFFRHQQDLIFIIISENTSSMLLIHERLDRIILTLYNNQDVEKYLDSAKMIEDPELDQKFETIMNLDDDFSDNSIDSIKTLFECEIFSGEIEAGALLSMRGKIYYSSLPIDDLHTTLKEIEIRTQIDTREVLTNPKFIWQTQEKLIFSQAIQIPKIAGPVYVVLLFDARTNLGMADWALEDICQKLGNSD